MTPRESAKAPLIGSLFRRVADALGYTCAAEDIENPELDILPVIALIDEVCAEHVRALLADDEATIEIMARALVIRTAEHYGDLLPIDPDLSLTKLLAHAVLAALRKKALVGALH